MESELRQERSASSLSGLGCPGQPFSMRSPWLVSCLVDIFSCSWSGLTLFHHQSLSINSLYDLVTENRQITGKKLNKEANRQEVGN